MAAEVAPFTAGHPVGFPSVDVAGPAAALRLFVPGEPISKGRPRTRVQLVKDVSARLAQLGGRPGPRDLLRLVYAQVYTPPETREWEDHVERWVGIQLRQLSQADDGLVLNLPFQGRVVLALRFNVTRPASYPKSVTLPLKAKGDIDNMAKSVIDGIQNAKVFANDRLITDLTCIRRFADAAHPTGVEIDLTGLS